LSLKQNLDRASRRQTSMGARKTVIGALAACENPSHIPVSAGRMDALAERAG
jgi:hypothetical protein